MMELKNMTGNKLETKLLELIIIYKCNLFVSKKNLFFFFFQRIKFLVNYHED